MKLFLSVPFSSKLDAVGNVEPAYAATIQQLVAACRAAGHEVFCTLDHTGYKLDSTIDPAEEFRTDFAEIDTSDRMYVLLEEQLSAGVQLEIGYAYARGVEMRLAQIGVPAWSNISFSALAEYPLHEIHDEQDFAKFVLTDIADSK